MTECLLGFAKHVRAKIVKMTVNISSPSDFQFAPAKEYLSCTNYWPPNPRKFILHAWKDLLIFAELTHHLFIAPYDRIQRRTKVSIWKPLWPLKRFENDAQQPTFYAIHAVSLGWFSFTATKHLPGQLHFQETLRKIHAFDNTQTKTQPCSKWRHLNWTLPWRHQLQPIIVSREENHIFNVCLRGVLRQKSTQEENFTNINICNQIISSVILKK